jgi:hypothetical protein
MRLYLIAEVGEQRLKVRVKNALLGKGKSSSGGLYGVMDEFGCDVKTAHRYLQMLGGGTYGEDDIEDKVLHRSRAPQALYKLMKYFNFPENITRKLIRFHIDNYKIIDKHRESPGDDVSLKQLLNKERLVSMLTLPQKHIEELGFRTRLVPWYDADMETNCPHGVWYVTRPENEDIVDLMMGMADSVELDLLSGLAFGYRMVDVFNYVRKTDKKLVDEVCGHVDYMER